MIEWLTDTTDLARWLWWLYIAVAVGTTTVLAHRAGYRRGWGDCAQARHLILIEDEDAD